MVGGPASVIRIAVEVRLDALRVVLHDSGANISTLLGRFILGNEVVKISIHDERPVDRIHIAQLRVLLDPYGTPRDVSQVVQADVLQAGQLVQDQSVVVEQVAPLNDNEVGEECAESLQTGNAKEEKVFCDDGQLGETKGAEDLLVLIVFVSDEKDLQVALNHRTVLQQLKITDVISNVNAGTTDQMEGKQK